MGRTACTEPQCLYKGTLYLTFLWLLAHSPKWVKSSLTANEFLRKAMSHVKSSLTANKFLRKAMSHVKSSLTANELLRKAMSHVKSSLTANELLRKAMSHVKSSLTANEYLRKATTVVQSMQFGYSATSNCDSSLKAATLLSGTVEKHWQDIVNSNFCYQNMREAARLRNLDVLSVRAVVKCRCRLSPAWNISTGWSSRWLDFTF